MNNEQVKPQGGLYAAPLNFCLLPFSMTIFSLITGALKLPSATLKILS